MKSINYYKISELSRITSISIPTIRFYLKEGLLPPPMKTGKTSAYYNDDHVGRLKLIKKLKADRQRTLSSIKEELATMPLIAPPHDESVIVSSEKRNAIVTAAISLFVNKGLGDTSIDDIVNEARIGKGTFYKFFKDKNDLFVQCADSVFYGMYGYVWDEIKNEKDMVKRLLKRGKAFYDSYPKWIDMMNLLRHASVGSNPFFKKKYNDVLRQIIHPISRDLEMLKRDGLISKNLNCLGAAYLLMGMTEYSARLIYDEEYDKEKILQIIMDLFFNGLEKTV